LINWGALTFPTKQNLDEQSINVSDFTYLIPPLVDSAPSNPNKTNNNNNGGDVITIEPPGSGNNNNNNLRNHEFAYHHYSIGINSAR